MVSQKTSLIERLKICWYALTKKNYVFFGIGKDPVVWDDNGKYSKLNENKVRCYTAITYDYQFNTNEGITNLHDFTWKCIEDFAKEAQSGKY